MTSAGKQLQTFGPAMHRERPCVNSQKQEGQYGGERILIRVTVALARWTAEGVARSSSEQCRKEPHGPEPPA